LSEGLVHKGVVKPPPYAIALHCTLAHLAADHHPQAKLSLKLAWGFAKQLRCCFGNTKLEQALLKALSALIEVLKNSSAAQTMLLRQNHSSVKLLDQTARRARPRLRRVRITRRPVWVRMRTRKPETRLRLRLVPPRVRLVIELL
jgi:hypothetical protein